MCLQLVVVHNNDNKKR